MVLIYEGSSFISFIDLMTTKVNRAKQERTLLRKKRVPAFLVPTSQHIREEEVNNFGSINI